MKLPAAKRVAGMGLLMALALALSFLEGLVPAVAGLPPGVKLGLSNVVTMFCLFYMGTPFALVTVVLKAGFAFIIRGFTAGLLSFAGGLTALAVMVSLRFISKSRASLGFSSIMGAVTHNAGQLIAAYLLIGSGAVFYYAPVLLLAGLVMGAVTGTVCKTVLPYLKKLSTQGDAA